VLAATNYPWDLDDALIRRLEKRVYIPLPTADGRRALFDIYFRSIRLADDVDLQEFARRTDGYSGADIESLCKSAAMMPFRSIDQKTCATTGEYAQRVNEAAKLPILHEHVAKALENCRSSVNPRDIQRYETYQIEFGST
jgi:katanin p60 ATPase-containing subunit A1